MSLQSMWFRGNQRLQQCLISDPAHVKIGDQGEHVALLQGALWMLDSTDISGDEEARQFYGQSTADAVLRYKTKRKIINHSYQTSPDDIVGRMTIHSLDMEMQTYELRKLNLILAFGIPSQSHGVVISQTQPLAAAWARQLVRANSFLSRLESHAIKPSDIVKDIRGAIKTAGPGGGLIFAVGHGVAINGYPNAGAFDIADNDRMRIGGKGAKSDPKCFVDVFYDSKTPGSPSVLSDKEMDEQFHIAGWKTRLERWAIYQELCKAFVDGQLRLVVILTCRVGNSTDFLAKVASQWHTPILAYRDFVWYEGIFPHVRAVLEKDDGSPGTGTNVPFSEICIPISPADMAVVSP